MVDARNRWGPYLVEGAEGTMAGLALGAGGPVPGVLL